MYSPLLITAFSAFPGVPDNPTETLLHSLEDAGDALLARARRVVLPTVYGDAPARMIAALDPMPRAILMTGYSYKAQGVVLERRATAERRADRPDASGTCPAPPAGNGDTHDTRVPVEEIAAQLREAGLPADLSGDAGGYVCNHVYHAALSGPCAQADGPVGLFVHLPAIRGTELAQSAASSMPLREMQRALAIIARAIA